MLVRCGGSGENKGIFHKLSGSNGKGPSCKACSLPSHTALSIKLPQGYHVQVTARSDQDLSPEGIVQKVSDASGAKYTTGDSVGAQPQPSSTSRPVFMPTASAGGAAGYNPLGGSRRPASDHQGDLDEDGWGADAPPITRTQLEKVESAYKPTRVNMNNLNKSQGSTSRSFAPQSVESDRPDVVKGAYQPVGKVDIAAIRREAQAGGPTKDDRPTMVKGAYEPVGKVDIAAIRARAQQQPPDTGNESTNTSTSGFASSGPDESQPKTLAERSAAFSQPERLTTLPKPKVPNRFGGGSGAFAGTKAPVPSEFGLGSGVSPKAAPPSASRTFADQGGKTPAQLWAEKKGQQGETAPTPGSGGSLKSPIESQVSGGGGWKSGYTGKSWAPVQTTKTGGSAASADRDLAPVEDEDTAGQAVSGGVGSIRDRFNEAPIMGAGATKPRDEAPSSPPPLDTSNKPNAGRGVPIPGLQQKAPQMPVPPSQPRSPTPPTPAEDEASPIRVAVPVSRNVPDIQDAREEQSSPPPSIPTASLSQQISHHQEPQEDEDETARAAAANVAVTSFDHGAVASAPTSTQQGEYRAIAQYDYERAEDNELELHEGEEITNIDMVDDDWWMGQNPRGETGLFPSNYVELVEGDASGRTAISAQHEPAAQEDLREPEPSAAPVGGTGLPTATALYDYEAGEDNELTFPEGAKITNVVSRPPSDILST